MYLSNKMLDVNISGCGVMWMEMDDNGLLWINKNKKCLQIIRKNAQKIKKKVYLLGLNMKGYGQLLPLPPFLPA